MVGPVAFQPIQPGSGDDPLEVRRPRDADGGVAGLLGRGPGVGGRRGPDEWDNGTDTRRAFRNQHSFAGEDFEIDTAYNYHGAGESA